MKSNFLLKALPLGKRRAKVCNVLHLKGAFAFLIASICWSFSANAQESQLCVNFSICLGQTAPLECSCNPTTFSGPGVQFINNVYSFNSNLTGAGTFYIDNDCSADDVQVIVYAGIEALINGQNSSSVTICQGASTTLAATGGITYAWTPTTGLSNPNIANPVATPAVTTTYTVTGTGEGGCTDVASVTVVVLPNATLVVNLDDVAICLGENITGIVTGGVSGYTYHIDQTPGNFSSNNSSGNINLPAATAGTYIITATLNDYLCPYTPGTETIEVMLPSAFTLSATENPICAGSSTNLHATSSDALTYVWSPAATLNTTTGANVIATPAGNTTYTVTATNAGGCTSVQTITVEVTENCCVMNVSPPTYTVDALTPDWVGVNYTLDQDLIIQAGVNFTISNCILKFAVGKGIKLYTGADLTVSNNSVLTTLDVCPGFWAGISAYQVANFTNAVDVTNLTVSGSTIEYASIGVMLYTYFALGPYSTTKWALLNITNSHFDNNRIDLILEGGAATNGFAPILGSIQNTEFVTDFDFPAGYVPNTTKSSFKNLAKAVPFFNCKFINEVPAFLSTFEFLACEYVNAPARMYSTSNNSNGINSQSRIVGFTRGVHATSSVGINRNIDLLGTDMANWRDAYVRVTGIHSIRDNDFYNLQAPMMTGSLYINGSLNYINVESGDIVGIAPYGLYMDGVATTTVLDNYFNTAIQLPGMNQTWAHGMIANNTGDNSNRVRRNVFDNMQRALKLQGDNRTTLYTDGLKYSCNTFENNLSDVRELNSNMGLINSFGVPHQLSVVGGNNADPNNNFTQSSSTCSICGNDDLSNTTTSAQANHNYVRLSGSQEPHDNETTDAPKVVIVFPPSGGVDECISNVQMIVGGGNGNATEQKTIAETNYNALHEAYATIVDGGNTEALVQEIQSTTYSEALQMYYDLMAQSPNVSDESLVEALKKYELPNVLLTQILSNNPHAAKSGRVAEGMEERAIPFEEYQKAQINQGLTLFSSKEYMELNMAALLTVRGDALTALMIAIDEDDNTADKTTAKLALLDETAYYTDLLQKIDLLAASGNYEAARQLTTDATGYYRLMPEDKTDMESMYNLLDIQEALNTDAEATLTNSQEAALYHMLDNTSAVVSTKALTILIERGSYSYTEPIMIDEGGYRSEEVAATTFDNASLLKVYPNPVDDLLLIEYQPAGIASLELYDATGRLVLQQKANEQAVQHYFSVGELPSSLYELRLLNNAGATVGSTVVVKK